MSEEVEAIKEKGNSCLRAEKYEEAVLHYSHAIKLEPKNHSLYSNRSLAFLKMQQYFLAMEDARETIRINPEWAKGYFRKAEVEFHSMNFQDALLSYTIALKLQPNDPDLEDAVERAKQALESEKAMDDQLPWIGAAFGIFFGAIIMVVSQIFTRNPIVASPLFMLLTTVSVSLFGYFIAYELRNYIKSQRSSLLERMRTMRRKKEKNEGETPAGKPKEGKTIYSNIQEKQQFKRGKP